MQATATPAPAVTRTIAKGAGPFVTEVFTDATGKVVRVNAYTVDQLNTIKTSLEAKQATDLKAVVDMLALLA